MRGIVWRTSSFATATTSEAAAAAAVVASTLLQFYCKMRCHRGRGHHQRQGGSGMTSDRGCLMKLRLPWQWLRSSSYVNLIQVGLSPLPLVDSVAAASVVVALLCSAAGARGGSRHGLWPCQSKQACKLHFSPSSSSSSSSSSFSEMMLQEQLSLSSSRQLIMWWAKLAHECILKILQLATSQLLLLFS